jgi:3D (Asp-Asp-Asp) domain-containing protein
LLAGITIAAAILAGATAVRADSTVAVPTEPAPAADSSKISAEGIAPAKLAMPSPVRKGCCGYPLSEEQGFALRYYWLAMQERFEDEHDETDIYTRQGFFIGTYPARFVKALRMEGSGLLSDGRVLNFHGKCKFGTGTCYEQLDKAEYPFGRGAGRRSLIPFKSVAVDRKLISIGEPLYVPELDGLLMPDGHVHDGCVRADDTGSAIKQRKMDFFVVSFPNFRYLLDSLYGVNWITPHIEHPRCEYLRQR